MKRIKFMLMVMLILLNFLLSSASVFAQPLLPEISSIGDFIGLSSVEEIERAVIVFDDGKSAELSSDDIERLMIVHLDAGVTLFVQPYNMYRSAVTTHVDTYANFYAKDRAFTIYSYGSDICIGSFGENNSVWYFTDMGNRRNGIRRDYEEIYERYLIEAKEVYEAPVIPKTDYLSLPEHEWAISAVKSAAASNILPPEIASDYESNISRTDFCTLMVQMLAEKLRPGVASHRIEHKYGIFNELKKNDDEYKTV